MKADPRGWNPRKSRSAPKSLLLPSSPPTHRPGPIVHVKTLVATKGSLTVTTTWHRTDGCWQLVSFPKELAFLKGTDDYLDAMPLLSSNGWLAQWHDSQVQVPVPILELEGQPQ